MDLFSRFTILHHECLNGALQISTRELIAVVDDVEDLVLEFRLPLKFFFALHMNLFFRIEICSERTRPVCVAPMDHDPIRIKSRHDLLQVERAAALVLMIDMVFVHKHHLPSIKRGTFSLVLERNAI